jgi:hypothetical protein
MRDWQGKLGRRLESSEKRRGCGGEGGLGREFYYRWGWIYLLRGYF